MRILFISTFYPPYVIGGWEQLVQEVNQGLAARGHVTRVLTSTHGLDRPTHEEGVDRLLALESDLYHYHAVDVLSYKRRLKRNLSYVRETVDSFEPDVIFIHIMWDLSRGIAWLAEQLRPDGVVYYIADHWPCSPDPHTAYWHDPAHKAGLNIAKQALAPIALKIIKKQNRSFNLKFRHVLCVSQAIKDELASNAGIDPGRMSVVYNGIDTQRFTPAPFSERSHKRGLSLLYAGSLVWHKGVHTTLEAMGILAREYKQQDVSLTIVGSGHPDYEAYLKDLVDREDLSRFVQFLGRVPRENMPDLLRTYDVLLFPSMWEEPLARMTQEAMAAGLAVIGTTTGGTKEILVEGETGLTFAPGDAATLARRIEQLYSDRELLTKLAYNARSMVVQRFDIRRMIDEIELHLAQAAHPGIRLAANAS